MGFYFIDIKMNLANHKLTIDNSSNVYQFQGNRIGIFARDIAANKENFRQGYSSQAIVDGELRKGDFFLENFDYKQIMKASPNTCLPFTLLTESTIKSMHEYLLMSNDNMHNLQGNELFLFDEKEVLSNDSLKSAKNLRKNINEGIEGILCNEPNIILHIIKGANQHNIYLLDGETIRDIAPANNIKTAMTTIESIQKSIGGEAGLPLLTNAYSQLLITHYKTFGLDIVDLGNL